MSNIPCKKLKRYMMFEYRETVALLMWAIKKIIIAFQAILLTSISVSHLDGTKVSSTVVFSQCQFQHCDGIPCVMEFSSTIWNSSSGSRICRKNVSNPRLRIKLCSSYMSAVMRVAAIGVSIRCNKCSLCTSKKEER